MRREMFESCQEVLAEMVHTKDGSRAVREFLAWGTAKVCFFFLAGECVCGLTYAHFLGSETDFESLETSY